MVYDCFTFFNELDLLEIRLNILDEVVDKFVIVEATKTHSNIDKPLYFEANKTKFNNFIHKIIHIVVDDFPDYITAWHYENIQRNAILAGINTCTENDVIIISDLDEIPNPKVLSKLELEDNKIYCLCTVLHNYYLNSINIRDPIWRFNSVKVFKNSIIINNSIDERFVVYNETLIKDLNLGCTPNKIRLYRNCIYIYNAGWHFSYLGSIEWITNKIKSFSHQEFNKSEFVCADQIRKKIEEGLDLYTGKKSFAARKVDQFYPDWIIRNVDQYDKFINPNIKSTLYIDSIIQFHTILGVLKNELGKIKYLMKHKLRRCK